MGKNTIHFSTKNIIHNKEPKPSNKFKLYLHVLFKKIRKHLTN